MPEGQYDVMAKVVRLSVCYQIIVNTTPTVYSG